MNENTVTVEMPEWMLDQIMSDVRASGIVTERGQADKDTIFKHLEYAKEQDAGPTFDTYQDLTERTAIYPDATIEVEIDGEKVDVDLGVIYTGLGLAGESGEIAEKIKKYLREGDDEYLAELFFELGDVQWYLARLADELGVDLSEIAEENLDKLLDRKERDVLEGEGDDR